MNNTPFGIPENAPSLPPGEDTLCAHGQPMTHTKPEGAVTEAEEALVERALSACDQLADEWASEIDLLSFVAAVCRSADLTGSMEGMAKQCFIEGAYRGMQAGKELQALRANNTAGVPVATMHVSENETLFSKGWDGKGLMGFTSAPLYASPTPIVEPVAPEAVAWQKAHRLLNEQMQKEIDRLTYQVEAYEAENAQLSAALTVEQRT